MTASHRLSRSLVALGLGCAMVAGIAQTLRVPGDADTSRAGAGADSGAGAASALAAAVNDGVTTRDAEWVDAARKRKVPVRIYLPAGHNAAVSSARAALRSAATSLTGTADTPGAPLVPVMPATINKWPLVVFSHGLGGTRLGYSHLGRHFAQHGFIALHLQHAGSDRAVWQGGPLTLLGNVRDAASEINALARVQDVSFALTTLLADRELGGLIDPLAIAIAGHSYGANTAMLIAGAAVERDGKRVSFADARVKAAILLSAPPFHGEADQAAVLHSVHLPTLHITGSEDVIRVPGYGSDVADRIGVFRDTPAARPGMKTLAIFEGGEHSVFTDRTHSERAMAIKAATRDLCLAFLRTTLLGQAGTVESAMALAKPLLIDPERLLARRLEAQLNSSSGGAN